MQEAPQPEKRSESGAPPTTRSMETLSPELVPHSGASASRWTLGPDQRRPGSATGSGLSIFQKLLILILSLVFVTVALPAVYLSARQLIERADVLAQALVAGALALFVGAAGAFWIARSLGNRIEAIARVAGSVAQGRLDQPELDDPATDEIGSLADAFNAMLRQLRTSINQIQRGALEEQRRLGQLVAECTCELDTRNADLRLVLDHVGQGFVILGRDGKMSRERSAILERWLGRAPPSDTFADYLAVASPSLGSWFELAWKAVIDGALPLALALDQLPKSLTLGEHVLQIGYRPIVTARGELERVLVVLSDLTPELARSRAAADERELILPTRPKEPLGVSTGGIDSKGPLQIVSK